ncbi:G-type lectin S-receptor-like serine/threonine-protein kinase At4g27290 [Neltuma alba]|uniref:G-type lectin S-receptor-like serine/threonine-protein kinase At4g27290 n=1 Tax=Neltuma alba TaxID=207710 RepID=UPI0010A53209|nr:G-type lectin S-receptor-like serine/threonine-protein kinase At4g27290 [Prosopis alba]
MQNLLIFVFSFTCIFFLRKTSSAANTLSPNQSLIDGQELTSAGQLFVLGFFTPGTSKSRYVGIWYKNITPQTVVWVANRENPLNDSSGEFTIGADGNLVLLDGEENFVWSSGPSRTIQDPIAKLLDSGNLVLIDGKGDSGSYIWQSFDHPTDTMLPGMRVGWDKNSGLNRYLTSWKGENDPSEGNFTYIFDHIGFPEIVLREGAIIKFRSGIWNGVGLNGDIWTSFTAFKPELLVNDNEAVYWNEPGDRLSRLVMRYDGQAERYIWDTQNSKWTSIYEARKDFCDNYGACGDNGICDINSIPVFCNCLIGFKSKSQEEWNAFSWSGGCTRRTPLNCTQGDKFNKLSSVKLPMLLQYWTQDNMSLEECKMKCLENCSCTAYANSALNGGPHGCLIWFGNLVDMKLLQTKVGPQQDLYVRLAASEVGSTSTSSKRKVAVVAISVSLALLVLCFIMFLAKKFKEKNMRKIVTANLGQRNHSEEQASPLFDMLTILAATNNFSKENQIGEGGFGPVYKGKMSDGQEIAVKRLSRTSKQGIKEFMNEVGFVAKFQHRNLVRVLGGCVQGEERMLVYEYMPNKSLDHFIFDPRGRNLLNWRKRYEIIMGIARGLLYLHQDSRLTIIHRDLKTSNILLDNDLLPKISDFGLAHIFEGDLSAVKAKSIVGTYGYISPEYAVHGLFSPKSDVFSFGVIVLEILSGIKNSRYRSPDHCHNLLGQAWILWKGERPLDFMDPSCDRTDMSTELIKCLQIGLLCVQKFPEDRPTMLSVVFMLSNECMTLPEPKLPGFFMEEFDGYSQDHCSSNAMTITLLEARN